MKGARWKLGSGENAAMRYPFALCDCRVITVLGRHIKKKENLSTYFANFKKCFRICACLFYFSQLFIHLKYGVFKEVVYL